MCSFLPATSCEFNAKSVCAHEMLSYEHPASRISDETTVFLQQSWKEALPTSLIWDYKKHSEWDFLSTELSEGQPEGHGLCFLEIAHGALHQARVCPKLNYRVTGEWKKCCQRPSCLLPPPTVSSLSGKCLVNRMAEIQPKSRCLFWCPSCPKLPMELIPSSTALTPRPSAPRRIAPSRLS